MDDPWGPPYWRNPIWPPPGLEGNCSEKTNMPRFTCNTTFMRVFWVVESDSHVI